MNNYDIFSACVSAIGTNCYILKPKTSKNALVIDPGGNVERIKSVIDSFGGICKAIILTHGHFDHIFAVDELRTEQTVVAIHSEDEHYLYEHDMFTQFVRHDPRPLKKAEIIFDHDGKYKIDEFEFYVMHTPGHTDGSACFFIENCMFSGDTLFKGAVGRTDLGGNDAKMKESLAKIASLDKNYTVYPGHEGATTLDYEKEHNSYLKGVL